MDAEKESLLLTSTLLIPVHIISIHFKKIGMDPLGSLMKSAHEYTLALINYDTLRWSHFAKPPPVTLLMSRCFCSAEREIPADDLMICETPEDT